jgi:hypothetical protein
MPLTSSEVTLEVVAGPRDGDDSPATTPQDHPTAAPGNSCTIAAAPRSRGLITKMDVRLLNKGEGQAIAGLRAFEERGQIVVADDRIGARQAAIDRWDQERMGRPLDRSLILTDSSNVDVDALNAQAQQRRLDAGELGARG